MILRFRLETESGERLVRWREIALVGTEKLQESDHFEGLLISSAQTHEPTHSCATG